MTFSEGGEGAVQEAGAIALGACASATSVSLP